MRRITIPFVGPSASARAAQVNNQETLNFITSVQGAGAKAPVVLESAPGLVERTQAGNGPCRSPQFLAWRHPTDGTIDAYAVFGTAVVRISSTGVSTIGTIAAGTTRVRAARGRAAIMFVDGSAGYSYDGSTFATISDADFPDAGSSPVAAPTHVVYLDGFFIVNDALSDNFHISDIEDPTSWNALEFEAAAVAPDAALALANTESELWVFGDETCQAFYNSGNADFPFSVMLAATQEVGVLAPQSVAESESGIFFLATTPEGGRFVYQIQGQVGRIVTGDEQSAELAAAGDLSGAYGFIYAQAGKAFYVLHLGPDRPTMVYNIRAQVWESRAMLDGSAWRIAGHGILEGENIGGSRLAARLYNLDLSSYTDAGTDFVRRRRSAVQHANGHLLEWWEVVIDAVGGVGNPTAPGDAPVMRLRFSDDGGATWSAQLVEPLGEIGQRQRRAVYRNLGSSRARVFELEVSDPVEVTIVAAYARVEVLED